MSRLITLGFIASVLILASLLLWGPSLWAGAAVRLSAYTGTTYAVYMDSGHIFYGTLRSIDGNSLTLSSVRSFQKFEVGNDTTNTLTLQRANPLTKPEDFLVINRAHILFYEKVGGSAPILSQGASPQ